MTSKVVEVVPVTVLNNPIEEIDAIARAVFVPDAAV